MRSSKYHFGFTLIELMIVLVIIGILAAVAIPNYASYVAKSNRKELTQVLVQLAARQEQYFTDFRKYTDKLDHLKVPPQYRTGNSDAKFVIGIKVIDNKGDFVIYANAKDGASGYQGKNDENCLSMMITREGRVGMSSFKKVMTAPADKDTAKKIREKMKSNNTTPICLEN